MNNLSRHKAWAITAMCLCLLVAFVAAKANFSGKTRGLLGLGSAAYPSASNINYFVDAGKGSDSNAGTIDQPFQTIDHARDAIRSLKSSGGLTKPVVVFLRGGTYRRTSAFSLTSQDSGTTADPITYQAYPGEKVVIAGSVPVTFQAITDTTINNRINAAAKGKVLVADLAAAGISDVGSIGKEGFLKPVTPWMIGVAYKDQWMPISRWPNNPNQQVETAWSTTAGGVGGGTSFNYRSGERPDSWSQTNDIYAHGYWGVDYFDGYVQILSINKSAHSFTTNYSGGGTNPDATPCTDTSYQFLGGFRSGANYSVLNVLEEVDQPGEWSVDSVNKKLYFYPPAALAAGDVEVSTVSGNLIDMVGASNIKIIGMTIQNGRANGVSIVGGSNNLIAGNTIRNFGNGGINLGDGYTNFQCTFEANHTLVRNSGSNNGAVSNDVYDTGVGGIFITGGDRKALSAAGNYANNNDIYRFSRNVMGYHAGITIDGVGNSAAHNSIHDAPWSAAWMAGNNHIFEYNKINNVNTNAGDAGAFYAGKDWTFRGNQLRYNYFANDPVNGIYLDDMVSGFSIYGNVFYKIANFAFLNGGGRDNKVYNNIFVNGGVAFHSDSRGTDWAAANVATLTTALKLVPYTTAPWSTQYPELVNILSNQPGRPIGTTGYQNIFDGNSTTVDFWQGADAYVTTPNNYTTVGTENLYVNKSAQDFTLVSGATPIAKIGFKPISFGQIGLLSDEYRDNGVVPATVTLTLNATNGKITASPSQSAYNIGDTVTLTATPNTGYAFTGWNGDAAGQTSPVTITMTTNKVVTANFGLPQDTTAPAVPTGLQSPSKTNSTVQLSWNTNTDADLASYKLYQGSTLVATVSKGVTVYTVTGLKGNTTYNFQLSAVDTTGNESAKTAVLTVTTNPDPDTTAPAMPTGFQSTGKTDTTIQLAWAANAETDLASYKVYKNGALLATIPKGTATYNATGLTANTAYTFTLSAVDTTGNESAKTASLVITTNNVVVIDTIPPATPTGLASSGKTDTTIQLAWTANTEADLANYRLYRNGTLLTTIVKGTNSYSVTGLTANTTYNFQLSAVDTTGNESAKTANLAVTTNTIVIIDTVPPATPKGLVSTGKTDSSIDLAWSANTEADFSAYKLYRNGILLISIAKGANTYSVTGLAANTTYNFQLSAVDTTGNESAKTANLAVTTNSKIVIDTVPPAVPTGLRVVSKTDTTAVLAWTANTEADLSGYKIYRSSGALLGSVDKSINTYTVAGLSPSTSYRFQISAFDASNNESAKTTTVRVNTSATPDTMPPTVLINPPTGLTRTAMSKITSFLASLFFAQAVPTYSTNGSTISLNGVATDNVGVVSVDWINDRGGSGTAQGTINWSTANIPLQTGNNTITVMAHDAAGNVGKASITISRIVVVPTATPTVVPTATPTIVPVSTPTATPTPTVTPGPTSNLGKNVLSGIVLDYEMNEGGGSTLIDSTSSGHNGIMHGGSYQLYQNSDYYIHLNGSSDYVELQGQDFMDGLTQGTISFWFKPDSSTGFHTIFGADSGSCQHPFELAIDNGKMEVWAAASGCSAEFNATIPLSNLSTFHYFAYTVSDTGNKFYLDGVQVTPTYTKGSASSRFFIGNAGAGTTRYNIGRTVDYPAESYGGTVDTLRIYNRALTPTEIQTDQNS